MFTKTIYKVVQLEPQQRLPELTPEMRESIASLAYHPGFQYLTKKAHLQSALLDQKLRTERFASKEDFEFVQSGIFWLDWLDNQIRSLTKTPAPAPMELTPDEAQLLREIEATISTVGN